MLGSAAGMACHLKILSSTLRGILRGGCELSLEKNHDDPVL